MSFNKISIDSDLVKCSLEQVVIDYHQLHKVFPTTLIVSIENIVVAYKLLRECEFHTMVVVTVPDLPEFSWMVCGSKGVTYSPGA